MFLLSVEVVSSIPGLRKCVV